MNWGKRILTIAGLMTVFASGLVGCSKSDNSTSNVSGNVALNGAATDTINGYPVSFTLSMGYGGSNYGSNYVTVNMNGYPVQMQAVYPMNYQGAQTIGTIGQYNVLGTALCMDTQNMYATTATYCQNVVVVAWVQPSYSYGQGFNAQQPAMQIGIYSTSGTPRSEIERVGYAASANGIYGSPALSSATDLATWLVQNAK